MDLVKVNIKTGKVMVNNLTQYWAKLGMNPGIKSPVYYTNPAMQQVQQDKHQKQMRMNTALMERIKKFNSKRKRKREDSWTNEELYQLAILATKRKTPYTSLLSQATNKLNRSRSACETMLRNMRKAGVV